MDNRETIESLIKEKDTYETLIRELDGKIAAYEELGTPEQISAVFDKTEEMATHLEELGSFVEIDEALTKASSILSEYQELGDPGTINEALDKAKSMVIKNEAEKLSTEFEVSVDVVRDMYETYGTGGKVRETLSRLLTSKRGSRSEYAGSPSQPVEGARKLRRLTTGL